MTTVIAKERYDQVHVAVAAPAICTTSGPIGSATAMATHRAANGTAAIAVGEAHSARDRTRGNWWHRDRRLVSSNAGQ
ncbi:hypothetical protein BST37_21705 [Mycobacterium noviomagense]|uniref:Uncharacterized protein n=1 Tax=Mycobacterium noviomagense TaxID=459858 RepID=A0ABX3T1M5_9MYCO|nr:hypothetical protein BST37_21705 [Mycobacterium noviomagense]